MSFPMGCVNQGLSRQSAMLFSKPVRLGATRAAAMLFSDKIGKELHMEAVKIVRF